MNRNIQSALLHVQHNHMNSAGAAAASSHESSENEPPVGEIRGGLSATRQSAILHALDEGDDYVI